MKAPTPINPDGPRLPVEVVEISDPDGPSYFRLAGVVSFPWKDHPMPIDVSKVSTKEFLVNGYVSFGGSEKTKDVVGHPLEMQYYAKDQLLPDGTTASCDCYWLQCVLHNTPKARDILSESDNFYLGFSIGRCVKGNPVIIECIGIYPLNNQDSKPNDN